MDAKRHAERRETLAYWPARDDDTGEAVGLVTDVSESGVNLHSKHAFSPGEKLTVRIAINPKLTGTDHITLHIENVWCRRSGVPELYHAGFTLFDVSTAAKQGIRNLLQAFSYPAPLHPSDTA